MQPSHLCAAFIAGVGVLAPLIASPIASAAVVTFGASKDASIFSLTANNSDGAGPGLFAGTDGNLSKIRSPIEFDIAANVPAGATITGVQVTLFLGTVAGGGGGGGTDTTPRQIELHRLSDDWGEGATGGAAITIKDTGAGFAANPGDATWNARLFSSTPWATPGGDFAPTASAATTVSQTIDAAYTWTSTPAMVSDVQNGLDNPSTNFGWMIENSDETDARTFRAFWSREATNAALRPQLQVTFTAVPEPAAAATLLIIAATATASRRSRANPCPGGIG
jgi:hypothetical protein